LDGKFYKYDVYGTKFEGFDGLKYHPNVYNNFKATILGMLQAPIGYVVSNQNVQLQLQLTEAKESLRHWMLKLKNSKQSMDQKSSVAEDVDTSEDE